MKRYYVVFATGNAGKLREAGELLEPFGCEVKGIKELGITQDAEETGKTFEANAAIKAREVFEKSAELRLPEGMELIVMSDDSGLCIDAFDGGPGVESARFLGHETSYAYKNARILEMLAGRPEEERGAHYACNICAITADGTEYHEEAGIYGLIADHPEGSGGFGYDPIFYLPDFKTTMACITEEEKNSISHRGQAIRQMAERLFRSSSGHGSGGKSA